MDGTIHRFDVRMGAVLVDDIGHPVTHMAVAHDGESVLAMCTDGVLRLLDRASGQLMAEYQGVDFFVAAWGGVCVRVYVCVFVWLYGVVLHVCIRVCVCMYVFMGNIHTSIVNTMYTTTHSSTTSQVISIQIPDSSVPTCPVMHMCLQHRKMVCD